MNPSIIVFIVLAAVCISTNSMAAESPKKLWQIAEPTVKIENNPRYSDVSFSSRWARPRTPTDPYNTLDAIEAFGATRLDWIYSYDAAFFAKVKKQFNVPISTSLTASISDTIDGNVRSKGRMRDIDGNLVTAPWMPLRWGAFYGCANNPAFQMIVLNYIKAGLDAGADGFQSDGVLPNEYMIQHGACFCEFCMDGFRDYLSSHYSEAELKAMNIDHIKTFDYRAIVRANNKTIPPALLESFKDFQHRADKNLMAMMRRCADAYAGTRVPFSTNNGSYQTWERNQALYDFGIAELMKEMATPWHLYGSSLKARHHGKFQIINMPKYSPDVTSRQEIVALTHRVIATGYAVGMPVMVPWDAWIRGDIRFFGEPQEFAHFYKMIAAYPHLFDDYEDAFVTGEHLRDSRYAEALPLEILSGSGQVYAFVRANPSDPQAPVVIHLVEWSNDPQPFAIKIDRRFFFDAEGLKIQSVSPYAPLDVLAEGNLTYVQLPALNPWAILVVEPSAVKQPPQPHIIPFGQAFSEPMAVSLSSSDPSVQVRYTLDGTDPVAASPLYTRPIAIDTTTVVTAAAFSAAGEVSVPVRAIFTHYIPIAASTRPEQLKTGLRYEVFSFEGTPEWQGFFREFPDFDALASVKSGITPRIDIGVSDLQERFGVRFAGYLEVPKTGLYRFYVRADDECKLFISGQLAVYNAGRKFSVSEMKDLAVTRGEHFEESAAPEVWTTGVTRTGLIALEQGLHMLDVHYTQMLFEKHLDIEWESRELTRSLIAADKLFTER